MRDEIVTPRPESSRGALERSSAPLEDSGRGVTGVRLVPDSLPVLALACFERGLAHQRKGEIEQALAAYGEAIRLEPTLVRPYHFRGRIHAQRRAYDSAVADLTQALAVGPADAAVYT